MQKTEGPFAPIGVSRSSWSAEVSPMDMEEKGDDELLLQLNIALASLGYLRISGVQSTARSIPQITTGAPGQPGVITFWWPRLPESNLGGAVLN